MDWINWLALAVSLLALLMVVLNLVRTIQLQSALNKIEHTASSLIRGGSQADSVHELITNDVKEVRSAGIAMGRRITLLEQKLEQLSDKQISMEDAAPERKIYSRAMRMVELGASLDEVIAECELPRAEAELLINLHKPR